MISASLILKIITSETAFGPSVLLGVHSGGQASKSSTENAMSRVSLKFVATGARRFMLPSGVGDTSGSAQVMLGHK